MLNKSSLNTFLMATSAILASGWVYAAPMTSKIDLPVPGTGIIDPNSSIHLSLNGLIKEAFYAVTCTLTALSPSQEKVDMQFNAEYIYSSNLVFFLNDQQRYNIPQASLNSGDNKFVAKPVSVNTSTEQAVLVFRNLDKDYSVRISNCYGKPVTDNN